jgi:hypothetical protein
MGKDQITDFLDGIAAAPETAPKPKAAVATKPAPAPVPAPTPAPTPAPPAADDLPISAQEFAIATMRPWHRGGFLMYVRKKLGGDKQLTIGEWKRICENYQHNPAGRPIKE